MLGFASGFQMDEVEEGEACYYRVNSNADPDRDLSYIDEKLQNVLGHFQKDFEGLVTAEGLGAKWGDYGSFLPTYQRPPSIWSQPKNLKDVQNFSSPEAPKVLSVEGAPKDAAQSTRLGAAPCSLPSLNTVIDPSAGSSDKKGSPLSSSQCKKSLVKEEPVTNKQTNSSDRRSLKVRIKINSDKGAKNKAAIFSSFGLDTTPSSSMGNSENSSGMPSQCAGTLDESPRNILQMMTSFPIPGGSPLSPLIESLLCLEMKEKHSQTSSSKAIKFSKEKKMVLEKSENKVKSNGEFGNNLGDGRRASTKPEVDKVGNMESRAPGQGSSSFSAKNPDPLSTKPCSIVNDEKHDDMAPPVCMKAKRNVSRKNMEISKIKMEQMLSLGLVREESLESISDHNGGNFEERDFRSSSIEKISESRSKNYLKEELVDIARNVHSNRNRSYTMSKADSDVSNSSRDLFGQKVVGHKNDEVKLPHGMEKSSSKGKKMSTRSRNSVDLASEAEGSLISGSYEVPKRKEKSGKVRNLKSQGDIKMVHVNSKARHPGTTDGLVSNHIHYSPERPSDNGASKSNCGVVEKKQGSSLNKSREIYTQKDTNTRLIPDSSMKESANDGNFSIQVGLVSVAEPAPAEPIVIEEDWVQCDRCETWRLLPYDTKPEQLPEKWVCRMLNWLPGMNRCEFSEDDTTQALRRLYQPESQSNLTSHVDRIVPGTSSADGLRLGMDHLNSSSNCTPNPPRMKPESKESHYAASNGGSVLISDSVKSFQQDVVKSRSLTDPKQKFPLERNTHKHKEKHEKSGDAKEKKLKSKRAADQFECGTPKRTRVDAVSGIVKTTKKMPSSSILEGELLQPGSSELKTYGDREISLKKRKLKDWQESQNRGGASKDEREDFVKEETSDIEFRQVKKSAKANAEGMDATLREVDEKLSIGKVTKLKNPVQGREEAFDLEMGQQAMKPKMKGSADDVDILNRDLGSELLSRAATSSSSKVSNSFKSRSHFKELKGSPVESVSSSPIRASNLEHVSPARRDNSRKKITKNGHIPVVNSAKKSLNVEGNTEIKQSGTVWRLKVSGASHPESTGFPVLNFQDNSNGQKFVGKSGVRGESKNLERPCSGDLQLLRHCHGDDKSNKNLNNDGALFRENSKKGSSLLSKVKDGSSDSNPKGIKSLSTRPSEMLASSKGCLREGAKARPYHVALHNGDARDLKSRIKLVKEERDNKLTRETPQQDPVHDFNDGVAKGSDLTRIESTGGSSSQAVSSHVAIKDPPAQISPSIPCSHKGNAFDIAPANFSGSGDSLNAQKQSKNAPSHLKNVASSQSCETFRKAEELKGCGDRFKDSGFPIEGNEAYFQAVLHFLIAASIRESCNYDINKHGEMSPMQIYSSTAKLSELCAIEYEKRNELAAAALAYKCVEVAYMRVVYCKNSTLSRDRHDLQASLQIIPQGESPSSSMSDVDSINNQVLVDKAAVSKSIGSQAGNHIIAACNRPNFVRLLDFTKDVNSAVEASYKSQNIFAAAIRKGSQNNEGIVSVKRVVDLSFQDVDELVRLVRAATDSISRQGFNSIKD